MFIYPIRKFVFLTQSVLYAFFLFALVLIWIFVEWNDYKASIDAERIETLEEYKVFLKDKTQEVCDFISYYDEHEKEKSLEEKQDFILDYIQQIRFQNNGYFFINKLDGQALLFDGKRVNGVRVNDLRDANGMKLYNLELQAYYKEGGDFLQYVFKLPDDTNAEKKISHIRACSTYGWMIGAGGYYPDIFKKDKDFFDFSWMQFKTRIWKILLVLLVVYVLLFFVGDLLSRIFIKAYVSVDQYFEKRVREKIPKSNNFNFVMVKELKDTFLNMDDLIDGMNTMEARLAVYNEELKVLVAKKTAELEKRAKNMEDSNADLERMNKVFVDREFRIKELKTEIEALNQEIKNLKNELDGK